MNRVRYVLSWVRVIMWYGVIAAALFAFCVIVMAQFPPHSLLGGLPFGAALVWFVRIYFPSSWEKHRPQV